MLRNPLAGFAPKALMIAALASFASGAAVAADLPQRNAPPYFVPPPIFTWTGFYIGANGGFGIGHGAFGGGPDFGPMSGGLAGVQAGYNYQSGPLVAGIEADIDFGGIAGQSVPKAATFTSGNVTSTGTLRGRFGYAIDRSLFFVTAGYTGANMRGSLTDNSTAPNLFFSQSNYLNGFVVGLGMEYAVTGNISVKAEYLYQSYGSANYFGGTVDSTNAGTRFSTLKGGVNYHF
jgi:outer membrane immunogenic protein